MTCIAGVVHEGRVWIGGDSAGVAGWSLRVRADRKVFRNGPYLFGFSGSFRMGNLLRYAFTPPEPPDWDVYKFMSTGFMDAVRKCLKEGGFAEVNNGVERGGFFLVGYREHLFTVCGDDIAVGSLYATRSLPPAERLRIALEAAERHSAGVRGPFHIEVTQ